MDTLLFTPAAVVDLLSQIDELHDQDIALSTEGTVSITIGKTTYTIADAAVDVLVSPEAVRQADTANVEALDELSISDDAASIESGVIKEFAKTLLLGGLVRLTSKLLRK